MEATFEEITKFRENFSIGGNYIPEHIENKTLQLFLEYGSYNDYVSTLLDKETMISKFLHSLYYICPETDTFKDFKNINQIKKYFRRTPNSLLNSKKYFEVVILFLRTYVDFNKYSSPYEDIKKLIKILNGLYKIHNIPFNISAEIFQQKSNGIYSKKMINIGKPQDIIYEFRVEPVFTEIEEENKSKLNDIIQDNNLSKVNEHLNQSYDSFVKNDYQTSIKQSYLVLEKLLKELADNHQLDVVKLFPEYQKKYLDNNSSIFGTSEIKGKIKSQINMIYSFRSKLEAHSDTETFDKDLNLYDIARFQLNEVMNLSILLWELAK